MDQIPLLQLESPESLRENLREKLPQILHKLKSIEFDHLKENIPKEFLPELKSLAELQSSLLASTRPEYQDDIDKIIVDIFENSTQYTKNCTELNQPYSSFNQTKFYKEVGPIKHENIDGSKVPSDFDPNEQHPWECPPRSIIYMDGDCFEYQFWKPHLDPEWDDLPVIIINPPGRITCCNYKAREIGITRDMTIKQARILSKDLKIFANDTSLLDPTISQREATRAIAKCVAETLKELGIKDYITENNSRDEIYIDVTNACLNDDGNILKKLDMEGWGGERQNSKGIKAFIVDEYEGYIYTGNGNYTKSSFMDYQEKQRLIGGGNIAKLLCDKIKEKVGISFSAGVGENKLIAKIACELHKPDCVTMITHRSIPKILKTTKAHRLTGFDSPWGEWAVERLGIEYISDLQTINPRKIRNALGPKGKCTKRLIKWSHGVDTTPIRNKKFMPGLSASKKFPNYLDLTTKENLNYSLWILCCRFAHRLAEDIPNYNRLAKTVYFEIKTSTHGDKYFQLLPKYWTNIHGEHIYAIVSDILQSELKHYFTQSVHVSSVKIFAQEFENLTKSNHIKKYSAPEETAPFFAKVGPMKWIHDHEDYVNKIIDKEYENQEIGELYEKKYGYSLDEEDGQDKISVKAVYNHPSNWIIYTTRKQYGDRISREMFSKIILDEANKECTQYKKIYHSDPEKNCVTSTSATMEIQVANKAFPQFRKIQHSDRAKKSASTTSAAAVMQNQDSAIASPSQINALSSALRRALGLEDSAITYASTVTPAAQIYEDPAIIYQSSVAPSLPEIQDSANIAQSLASSTASGSILPPLQEFQDPAIMYQSSISPQVLNSATTSMSSEGSEIPDSAILYLQKKPNETPTVVQPRARKLSKMKMLSNKYKDYMAYIAASTLMGTNLTLAQQNEYEPKLRPKPDDPNFIKYLKGTVDPNEKVKYNEVAYRNYGKESTEHGGETVECEYEDPITYCDYDELSKEVPEIQGKGQLSKPMYWNQQYY